MRITLVLLTDKYWRRSSKIYRRKWRRGSYTKVKLDRTWESTPADSSKVLPFAKFLSNKKTFLCLRYSIIYLGIHLRKCKKPTGAHSFRCCEMFETLPSDVPHCFWRKVHKQPDPPGQSVPKLLSMLHTHSFQVQHINLPSSCKPFLI